MNIDRFITLPNDFFNWSVLRGQKLGTAKRHRNQLSLLLKNNVDLSDFTSIQNYLTNLRTRGLRNSYINSVMTTLRVYGHYAKEKDIAYALELDTLKLLKAASRTRATMSDEEITKFLDIPPIRNGDKQKKKHDLWTLFFSIMAYSGMRCGEVAKLKGDMCDFGRGVFVLSDTKTNDSRYVPIAPNIVEILQTRLSEVGRAYLFPSKRPEGIVSNVEWQYQFQTRIERIGIVRPNLVPYSLRHSLITRLLEEDVNIYKVQKIVGHRDIKTTAIYAHLTTKDIIAAINKHPAIRKHLDPISLIRATEEFIVNLGIKGDRRFEINITQDSVFLKLKATNS